MRVLVTGATGFVGGHLVPALLSADHDVSVLVRDRDGYDGPDDVTVFEGDLLDPGSFDDALDGVEAAYYLVHSMRAGPDYAERDRRAATNFVAAAEDAGVERVVYLGGLGEEREQLSEHLESRREVEHILDDAAFALTSLRAAIIVGKGSASFEMVRQLAVRLPVMVTPQWVDTSCQPIAIDDVVAYLVGVLEVPELAGRTVEIGGPEVMSYKEVMARTAEIVTGRRPVILPVPVLTPKLSAYWVNFVTDVPRSVAHPLILGLKNAVVVQDDSIREYLPIELTPFETAVRRAVGGGTDVPEAKIRTVTAEDT
ncbi:MAG: NAD(P)H-binding protein [Halorientalis sp.]